jgi:hypothetical protein
VTAIRDSAINKRKANGSATVEYRVSDPALYRPSHRRLLSHIPERASSTGTRLDGIVVPTIRSLKEEQPGLQLAAQLAAVQDSQLMILCSQAARSGELPESMRRSIGYKIEALDLPDVEHDLPTFRSSQNSLSTIWRANDVGSKRNFGLITAVRERWNYILFIDDDISAYEQGQTLNEDGLLRALDAMDTDPRLGAIGWTVDDLPDNSVVGNALRLANKSQQIFIGGGALLVRCNCNVPFFPDIYNEDWLFLIAMGEAAPDRERCFAIAGRARQSYYDEYSLLRARSQVAGDILGEGLMNLLEDKGPAMSVTAGRRDYWQRVLDDRESLIIDICNAIDASPNSDDRLRAKMALRGTTEVYKQIRAKDLSNYVADWKADLQTWYLYLNRIARSTSGLDHADFYE